MDEEFIKVVEKEDSDVIEFAKEDDDTVLLKTLQTQFPDAIGLKYKGPTGAWRAIKEENDALLPPKDGWGDNVYILSVNNKRKSDSYLVGQPGSKLLKSDNLLGDLAVIGLAFETKENDLKVYIEENYGPLDLCSINMDKITGKSKGFGFVRFKDEESAKAALEGVHFLHGRKFQVRQKIIKPMKLFVNGLPHGSTQESITTYFSQYGNVTDCYVPKDFKGFAFFTLSSREDAINVLKEKHFLEGNQLNVKRRTEAGQKGDGKFQNDPPGFGGRGQGTGHGNVSKGGQKPSAEQLKNMLFEFLTT